MKTLICKEQLPYYKEHLARIKHRCAELKNLYGAHDPRIDYEDMYEEMSFIEKKIREIEDL